MPSRLVTSRLQQGVRDTQPTEKGISKLAFAQTSLKENGKRYRERDRGLGSDGRAASKLGSNEPNSRLHFKQALNSCSVCAEAFLKKEMSNHIPLLSKVSLEEKIQRKFFSLILDLPSTLCLHSCKKPLSLENRDIQKKPKAQKAKRILTNTTVRL